jgi:cobalt-zinc-cadmium efflux system protein
VPPASAHVLAAQGQDCHAVRQDIEQVRERDYQISHTTLQVDHVPGPLAAMPGGGGTAGRPHCDDSHGTVHRPAGKDASGD